jgi:mannose-6-phosphate isomerase-like protein (cupin superfamily)
MKMKWFYIVSGSLPMEVEKKRPLTMHEGDFFVVKKRINHRFSRSRMFDNAHRDPRQEHNWKVKSAITKQSKIKK